MTNSSLQAPAGAAISDKMNTLRAIVHRNTLAAAYKNYMGRHDQAMHTTLFNLANPSSGERRVSGAGDVRAKDAGGEVAELKRGDKGFGGYGVHLSKDEKAALKLERRTAGVPLEQEYFAYRDMVSMKLFGSSYEALREADDNNAARVSATAATSFAESRAQALVALNDKVGKEDSKFREIYETRREVAEQRRQKLLQDAASTDPTIALRATRELTKQDRRDANFDKLIKREKLVAATESVKRESQKLTILKALAREERYYLFDRNQDRARIDQNQVQNENATREEAGERVATTGKTDIREAGLRVDPETLAAGGGTAIVGGRPRRMGSQTTLDQLNIKIEQQEKRLGVAKTRRAAANKRVDAIISLRSEGYFPKGTGAGKDYVPGSTGRGTGRIARFQRPDLFDYEKTIPAGQARLAKMIADKPNDPTGATTGWNKGSDNYWNRYTAPLNAVVAKSPEAAGLNFLKQYFRNLSGMDAASNVPMRNLRPEQSTYGKSSRSAGTGKMVTQEKLTELYRLINRGIADATRASDPAKEASGNFSSRPGNKKGGGRVTREEVRDFIINQLGVDAKLVDAYKELSDFQFSYKMLREISNTLDAIATYKSRQHNKHVGDVVKQNMARYFRF